MIAEFKIENFFSIKSAQTISFVPTTDRYLSDIYTREVKPGVRLLKIGFIYGANASGKSNILHAFDFFKNLVLRVPRNRNESTGVVPFLLDNSSRDETTKLSMTFFISQTKHILSFELNDRHICSETLVVFYTSRPTRLYGRSYDAATDSTIIEFGSTLNLPKKDQDVICGNTINNCSVIAAFGKSNVARTQINSVYDYFSRHIQNVCLPGFLLSSFAKTQLDADESGSLKRFILTLLKASDFNIEDFALNRTESPLTPQIDRVIQNAPISPDAKKDLLKKGKITDSMLTFKHKAGHGYYELPEKYESNGTMRFLGMASILHLLLNTDTFMPIDEAETSIHYELLSYFIKVFLANSERPSQLLLTTHDINLLNEDFIRRDTIWFTDKNEFGETKLVRLSSLGLHKNLSPYNAYRQGKLVNLPFLGSQYLHLNH